MVLEMQAICMKGQAMSFKDQISANAGYMRELRKAMPETFAGFMELQKAATVDNALSKKQKEFVALGIAVAIRCEGCILSHVAALVKAGAYSVWLEYVPLTCHSPLPLSLPLSAFDERR